MGALAAAVALVACGGENAGGGAAGAAGGAGKAGKSEDGSGSPAELYAFGCAPCHGAGGVGTQLGSALDDRPRDVQQVVQAIQAGVASVQPPHVPMPARGDGTWTDQQVRSVAEYVASFAK
ncbi:MAG TPA: cytochrome c [Acetobacteraceae bacterium]|nr:cytochrome c [Acetobacteraceae bacterium]